MNPNKLIILFILALTKNTYCQNMLVNTYNYYTINPNVETIESYRSHCKKKEGEAFAIIGKKKIIHAARLEIFDYNIYDYFDSYEVFVPKERQEIIFKEVLSNSGDLEPEFLLEFFKYLEFYLKTKFPNDNYTFTILNKRTNEFYMNPARIYVNRIITNISTIHSTFSNPDLVHNYEELVKHKDDAEIRTEYQNDKTTWVTKWVNIHDGMEYVGDNITLIFKKKTYGQMLKSRFSELYDLCEMAIKHKLKIHRNSDWLG